MGHNELLLFVAILSVLSIIIFLFYTLTKLPFGDKTVLLATSQNLLDNIICGVAVLQIAYGKRAKI